MMTSVLLAALVGLPNTNEGVHRRVYVLHSGVHTILANRDKNQAAKQLRRALLKRGVPDRDIIMMSNPFPTASWKSMFPTDLAIMFALYSSPETELSQERYIQLDQLLRTNNVSPDDEIIWIGHSAGGQVGITMAHFAKNLSRYPNLAAKTQAYRINTVVTLGTPIGGKSVPAGVKLRCYYSPADTTVSWVAQYGPMVLWALGHDVGIWITPPNPSDDFKMRIFRLVAHPHWCVDPRVLNRVISDTQDECTIPRHMFALAPDSGTALMGLIWQALDMHCDMCLEDSPWLWRQQPTSATSNSMTSRLADKTR